MCVGLVQSTRRRTVVERLRKQITGTIAGRATTIQLTSKDAQYGHNARISTRKSIRS